MTYSSVPTLFEHFYAGSGSQSLCACDNTFRAMNDTSAAVKVRKSWIFGREDVARHDERGIFCLYRPEASA